MNKIFLLLILLVTSPNGFAQQNEFPKLTGPYLGQKPPGETPELFANGIITTKYHEHSSPSFSPSGDEVFWSAYLAPLQSGAPQVILTMKIENGEWTNPEVAPFSGCYDDGGPRFSPDGKRLYFYSERPLAGKGEPKDADIWYVEKIENGWSEPINLGDPVNTDKDEWQPSISATGTIYFRRENKAFQFSHCIYYAKFENDIYTEPQQVDSPINIEGSYAWCPFIAPDESYLLFASNRKNPKIGFGDIYISFKSKNRSWLEPIYLENGINSDDNDRFPTMSPDGKFLFFTSKRKSFGNYFNSRKTLKELLSLYDNPGNGLDDVYWFDAKIIEELKKTELQGN